MIAGPPFELTPPSLGRCGFGHQGLLGLLEVRAQTAWQPTRAVDTNHTFDIAITQAAKMLGVRERHQLAARVRVIETNRVTDLMRDRVPQIVHGEAASEADFPLLFWVEANQGFVDLAKLAFTQFVIDIRKCMTFRFALRSDQYASRVDVVDFLKIDVGDLFPHIESCAHFLIKRVPLDA